MIALVTKGNQEIRRDVLAELRWDPRVDAANLGVDVIGGVVTLTGTVSSWAKKVAAEQAALRVLGVLDVASEIEVRLPHLSERPDTDIAVAVRQALDSNAMVPGERIRTSVSAGVVTLRGTVEHAAQREDAEQCVRTLDVVRGVVNHIEVLPPDIPAADILRSIEGALERHAERQAHRIELAIRDGRVTVSGTVRSWSDWRVVLGVVRGTRGVGAVDDRLRVNPYA